MFPQQPDPKVHLPVLLHGPPMKSKDTNESQVEAFLMLDSDHTSSISPYQIHY